MELCDSEFLGSQYHFILELVCLAALLDYGLNDSNNWCVLDLICLLLDYGLNV